MKKCKFSLSEGFFENLLKKLFLVLCSVGTSKRRLMSTSQLVDFLNKTQRDPRLNEILYPYANTARAKELICEYEPNKFNSQKGQLSLDGFTRYRINFLIAKLLFCLKKDFFVFAR